MEQITKTQLAADALVVKIITASPDRGKYVQLAEELIMLYSKSGHETERENLIKQIDEVGASIINKYMEENFGYVSSR